MAVDDEPDLEVLIRQKYRRLIREGKLEFEFAENGQDALDKLQGRDDIDIVLTDINMPKMDGLTLLEHLSEISPVMKTIIVSAYGDMENIRVAMNRGAFDFVTKPINFDDLQQTIEKTFNFVLQQKETIKAVEENDILKMYVDQDVIRFMSSNQYEQNVLANESVEATVAFFDIVGYTSISEKYPPDTVVNILNKYFDIMVQEIEKHNGQIDKFMGDCVMSVFRGKNHLDDAMEASLATRERFNDITEQELDGYKPEISIGINSGEMISGNIGSESLKRLDYTVIGDIVNTAQRFQSAASAGQIAISEDIYQLRNKSFQCEEIGEVELKNKANPVRLYNVIA